MKTENHDYRNVIVPVKEGICFPRRSHHVCFTFTYLFCPSCHHQQHVHVQTYIDNYTYIHLYYSWLQPNINLDLENAFNTISRRSFFEELYKNPDLHPIVLLVEMIYSRDDSTVLFQPQRCIALARHGSIWYGCPTTRSSWPAFVQLSDQQPLRNIGERCKNVATMQAFSDDG
jgi:hypothetical protein